MSISFIRVDDRMIHGQTCTRWALEYPCDGLIAVNDKAATTPVLKAAYKNASDKKTFVWTLDEWRAKCGKVLASKDRYFLITKNPLDMAEILVNFGFVPGDVKTVIVGPATIAPAPPSWATTSPSRRRRRRPSRASPRQATPSTSA